MTKEAEGAKAARRIAWADAWDNWLKQVLAIGGALVLVVLYIADVLPERAMAALVVGGVIGAVFAVGAFLTWRRAPSPPWRAAVAVFAALWLVAAGYPAVRALFPPSALASVQLGHTGPTAVQIPPGPLRAELRVTGHLKGAGGEGDVSAEYAFTVADAAGRSEKFSGRFRRSFVTVRARRGVMHRRVEQETDTFALHAAAGPNLTFTTTQMGPSLDSVTVDVLPAPIPTTWIYALAALVIAAGAVIEARLSTNKARAPALVAAGPTLVFALAYRSQATPAHLVQPAVGAVLIGALAALAAAALAAVARKLVPRPKA